MLDLALTDHDLAELTRLRRDIHRHPELGFREERTADLITDYLESAGVSVRRGVGKTGVVGLLGERGPCIALRADMDALPIREVSGRDYGSLNDGVMHACGHDGHTATLLVVMAALARQAKDLPIRVLAIFQPAEEGLGGAVAMINDGALADPVPEAIFGLHFWSQFPTGQIGVKAGPCMAAVHEFTLRVKGRGGHGAAPQETADPIVAGAALVTSLQTIVSRRSDPLLPVVLSVCEFKAGSSFNIIPEDAILRGTLRCFDPELGDSLPGWFEETVSGVCSAHGCAYDLDYRRCNEPLINDDAMSELVRAIAAEQLGETNIVEETTLGGEDMGAFLARVPGCFFFVGSGNEARATCAPHHNPAFDLDEDALAIGARVLLGIADRFATGAEQ